MGIIYTGNKDMLHGEFVKRLLDRKIKLGLATCDAIENALHVYLAGIMTDFPDLGYQKWVTFETDLDSKIDEVKSPALKSGIYRVNAEHLLMRSTIFSFNRKEEPRLNRDGYLLICKSYYDSSVKYGENGNIDSLLISAIKKLYSDFSKWVKILEGIKISPAFYETDLQKFMKQIEEEEDEKQIGEQIDEIFRDADF